MPKNFFGWVLFIGLAIMLFMLLNKGSSQYALISIDEFTSRLKNDRVAVVTVETDRVFGEFRQDDEVSSGERVRRFQVQLPAGTTQNWTFMQWLLDNRHNAMVRVENNPHWLFEVIIPLIPWLLIFGFIWFFVFRTLRKAQFDPNAPRPVYIVPPPQGQAPLAPPPPLVTSAPPSPSSTPAPGGDN